MFRSPAYPSSAAQCIPASAGHSLAPVSCNSPHQCHSTGFTALLFSYSYALFCTAQNAIPNLFSTFRTLTTKPRGWGISVSPAGPSLFATGSTFAILSSLLFRRKHTGLCRQRIRDGLRKTKIQLTESAVGNHDSGKPSRRGRRMSNEVIVGFGNVHSGFSPSGAEAKTSWSMARTSETRKGFCK